MYKADATKAPESDGLHNELQIISGKSLSLFVSTSSQKPTTKRADCTLIQPSERVKPQFTEKPYSTITFNEPFPWETSHFMRQSDLYHSTGFNDDTARYNNSEER